MQCTFAVTIKVQVKAQSGNDGAVYAGDASGVGAFKAFTLGTVEAGRVARQARGAVDFVRRAGTQFARLGSTCFGYLVCDRAISLAFVS